MSTLCGRAVQISIMTVQFVNAEDTQARFKEIKKPQLSCGLFTSQACLNEINRDDFPTLPTIRSVKLGSI